MYNVLSSFSWGTDEAQEKAIPFPQGRVRSNLNADVTEILWSKHFVLDGRVFRGRLVSVWSQRWEVGLCTLGIVDPPLAPAGAVRLAGSPVSSSLRLLPSPPGGRAARRCVREPWRRQAAVPETGPCLRGTRAKPSLGTLMRQNSHPSCGSAATPLPLTTVSVAARRAGSPLTCVLLVTMSRPSPVPVN